MDSLDTKASTEQTSPLLAEYLSGNEKSSQNMPGEPDQSGGDATNGFLYSTRTCLPFLSKLHLPNWGDAPRQRDIELGSPPHAVRGYPMLAERMGEIPEMAAFRSFAALNAKHLLSLQSELIELERKLRIQEEEDSNAPSSSMRSKYAANWGYLSLSGGQDEETEEDRKNGAQVKIFRKMQKKLKQYNEALIQANTIMSFSGPSGYDLKALQAFLEQEKHMNWSLSGEDRDTWGSRNTEYETSKDLVVLKSRHNEDPFSKWVTEKFIPRFHDRLGFRYKHTPYKDSDLLRNTQLITAAIASMLPVISIVLLYLVDSVGARLGIIAAFNFTLSLCMCRFTSANRSEIFAATAAFAAVQVVFVGTNGPKTIGSSCNC